MNDIRVRRVYRAPEDADGARVLVDRLWPRGLAKNKAELTEWCKDIAPSSALRTWYGHDRERFEEFDRRYRRELEEPERVDGLSRLEQLASRGRLTLLTGAKDPGISQAEVLADLLRRSAAQ